MALNLSFMNSHTKPQPHIIDAYRQLKKDLGGKFCRKSDLNTNVFQPVIFASQRTNSPDHVTRVMLLGPGNLRTHYHEHVTEVLQIVSQFNTPYGHLFYPGNTMTPFEDIGEDRIFTIRPFEPHGLALLHGYLLLKLEIHGLSDVEDIKWAS